MNLLIPISIRNLLRQKHRTVLLGSVLAFGMAVLVVVGALGRGISDLMINKINGHVSILLADNGNFQKSVFHNMELLLKIVHKTIPEAIRVQEEMYVFGKVVGKGKADHLEMRGLDMEPGMDTKELKSIAGQFRMLEGDVADLLGARHTNPVLISKEKAKFLRVQAGDTLKVRYRDINRSVGIAELTIVGIFNPVNLFMARPLYLKTSNLRALMGYGPNKTAQIDIMLANPRKDAKIMSRKLHQALKPEIAFISGTISGGSQHTDASIFGYQTDSAGLETLPKAFVVREGDTAAFFNGKGIAVTTTLANELLLRPGDTCRVQYQSNNKPAQVKLPVNAVVDSKAFLNLRAVIVNDNTFLKQYYQSWPDSISLAATNEIIADTASSVYQCLARQWQWKPYDSVTISIWERMSLMGLDRVAGTIVEALSMYETAAMVTAVESGLNALSVVLLLVLFCIILVGVVNSLRMTIRERTREIGTLRAIGMQRGTVRNLFILETFFLTFFALVTGVIAAFIIIAILKTVPIEVNNLYLHAILMDGHLHFLPDVGQICLWAGIVMFMSISTAWFPAVKAAAMDPARSLGHYE
jgi:ABC-type lipoprotein release transport system permease subunit